MTFHPRMQSVTEGFSVIGDLKLRVFEGAIADLWDVSCSPGAQGEYVSHAPRLVAVLDQTGAGRMDLNASPSFPSSRKTPGSKLFYVPAGLRTWSRIVKLSSMRHLDIHFDIKRLSEKLTDDFDHALIDQPRLCFEDSRVLSLAKLVANECESTTDLHCLYGDSLICALFVALAKIEPSLERHKGQLSSHHLKKVIEFIEDNHAMNIRLDELAGLTGLSSAYFCHVFKKTTGVPPHKWQMRARINRAKTFLEHSDMALSEIAVATGFSDQAHFTRVFRQIAGTTPQAWRRSKV